jgi:hypothetical protein
MRILQVERHLVYAQVRAAVGLVDESVHVAIKGLHEGFDGSVVCGGLAACEGEASEPGHGGFLDGGCLGRRRGGRLGGDNGQIGGRNLEMRCRCRSVMALGRG